MYSVKPLRTQTWAPRGRDLLCSSKGRAKEGRKWAGGKPHAGATLQAYRQPGSAATCRLFRASLWYVARLYTMPSAAAHRGNESSGREDQTWAWRRAQLGSRTTYTTTTCDMPHARYLACSRLTLWFPPPPTTTCLAGAVAGMAGHALTPAAPLKASRGPAGTPTTPHLHSSGGAFRDLLRIKTFSSFRENGGDGERRGRRGAWREPNRGHKAKATTFLETLPLVVSFLAQHNTALFRLLQHAPALPPRLPVTRQHSRALAARLTAPCAAIKLNACARRRPPRWTMKGREGGGEQPCLVAGISMPFHIQGAALARGISRQAPTRAYH